MTVTIPQELELAVQRCAQKRHVPVERLVQEALQWYLQIDPELVNELAAWQDVRDEACLMLLRQANREIQRCLLGRLAGPRRARTAWPAPAIIWQDTAAFARLPTVLIVPLTSRLDALRFPATRRIDPTPANGLSSPSVALIFQLGAADINRIRERLGRLDESDLQGVQAIAKQLQRLA